MSSHGDGDKKHRHDVGNPDHGPTTTEHLTRAIQGVLAACIALTIVLTVWSLWVAG